MRPAFAWAVVAVIAGAALSALFSLSRRPAGPPSLASPSLQQHPVMPRNDQQALQLTVLTLNAWGLWVVARRRAERVAALADYLRSPACTADVIMLQEVWMGTDVELLRQAAAEGRLVHSFHYQSGAIGSGLVVLSRYPIAEAAFHPYSARGDPAALLNGDFLAGKGVGWAAIQTPAGTVSVFNTHLSANYGQEWQVGAHGMPPSCRLPRDSLAGVRLLQMLELAAFVRARSQGAAATVLAGDLNAAPDTLEMAVLQVLLPELHDSWAEAQPLLLGATANALESSFTTAGAGHRPIRIDYILSTGQPLGAELALTDTGKGFSYSDHLGVQAVVQFVNRSSGLDRSGEDGCCRSATCPQQRQLGGLLQALELMQQQPAPFQEAASAIEHAASAMQHGRRRFARLAAGLWTVGVGCLGALLARPWWQERPTETYVLLLSGLSATLCSAGMLFLGGFVARGMEHRALQQAALQLRLAVGTAPKFAG